MRKAGALLALVALLVSSTAVAAGPGQGDVAGDPAPGSPAAIKRAKKHFQTALTSYKNGAYREAIAELQEALRFDPNGKDLVYNLAVVHEKLGELDQAIEQFRRYSQMETDPKEIERVEKTIKRLEGARDELRAKEQAATPPPTERPPPKPDEPAPEPELRTTRVVIPPAEKGRLDAFTYGAAGVAGVATVVGVVYAVRAVSTRPGSDEATGPNSTVFELQDRAQRAHNYAVTADVAFVIAALSGGATALLYFGRDKEASPPTRIAVDRTGVRLSTGVAF
ncbi:MAG: tetratricopeptide repeat protein [Polyangiaceae bacterium]|nr:tetratricopeptide repeat protein [Polyangiaceae bacterium]